MARKRKHHNKRRHHNRRRHHNLANARHARRAHRHHNRRKRGWRLFNPGPQAQSVVESLTAALLAGGAGYIASKAIGIAAENYLPDSIPQKALVGTAASGIAAAILADKFLKSRPKLAAGITVGAMIPLAEELIAMTPVGAYIGIVSDSGSAPSALPAPGGMSAALAARLGAHLSANPHDEDVNWSPADY